MADGVDPNRVILTGENPYVRLALSPDGELTSLTSLWKVIMSPEGPGNALFIVSDLTERSCRESIRTTLPWPAGSSAK